MIAERNNYTPAQIREMSRAWFDKQVEILKKAHGARWPEHEEWLTAYLREELRERLVAIGWRAK
jgi:hypothetical protein